MRIAIATFCLTALILLSPAASHAVTVYNGGGDLDQAGSWDSGLPSSSQDGLINSDGTLTAAFVANFGGDTTIDHTAGDLDFGTNAFNMHGATNTYNMSGGSITAASGFSFNQLTFNLGGGTITIGSATIVNSSLLNVFGSAVIDLGGLGASTGTIDFQDGWTGSFRFGTFSGTDWQDAFTTGLGNLDFEFGGVMINAATFNQNFQVTNGGTTLSLIIIPEPSTFALGGLGLLGLCGVGLRRRRRRRRRRAGMSGAMATLA